MAQADVQVDNTANGNEAVLQCSPGSFCCDANRPELSGGQACCDASPMRFSIDGNVAMTSMSEAPSSATAVPTNSASSLAESGSMPSSGQITSSIPSSQITGSTNATSVVFVTSVLNQDGKATVTTISKDLNTNPYTSHTAAIIGGAVGGAVALIALLALSFWLLRRRQGREPPHLFRILSLKDGLDSMYKDQRSPDSSSRSNAPSELVGSVPEPDAANDEKDWEKRYEKPGDVGRVSRLAPQRSARELLPGSPLSQSFSHETRDSAELPADTKIHELPDSPRPKSQRVAQ